MVNGSNNGSNNYSENLFAKNNYEQNVVNSIDGANALKLDESFEIKNDEEQNALIDSFENKEENQIKMDASNQINAISEIPTGVSIESASYMENNSQNTHEQTSNFDSENYETKIDQEYAPKLFSEEDNSSIPENKDMVENDVKDEQLFDQDTNEDEDFEIPAFLRRQKF